MWGLCKETRALYKQEVNRKIFASLCVFKWILRVEKFTEKELVLFMDEFPKVDYQISFKVREDAMEAGWSDVDRVLTFLREFEDPLWL